MNDDDVWRRDEPLSPCIKVCVLDPTDRICTGCHRTLDEIAAWSKMDDAARRAVIEVLPTRAARSRVRRGGRVGRLARQA